MQIGFVTFGLPAAFANAIARGLQGEVTALDSVEATIDFIRARAQAPAIFICQPSVLPADGELTSSLASAIDHGWFRILAFATDVDRAALTHWPPALRRHIILLPMDDNSGATAEQIELITAQLESEVHDATTQGLFHLYEQAYAADLHLEGGGISAFISGIAESVGASSIAAYLLDGDGTQLLLDRVTGSPVPQHLQWAWFEDQFVFQHVCRTYRLSDEQASTLSRLSHRMITWPEMIVATFRVDSTPVCLFFGFADPQNHKLKYRICHTAAREVFHLYRARDMAITLDTLQQLSEMTSSDRAKNTVLWAMLGLLKLHFSANGASLLEVLETDGERIKFEKIYVHQGRRDKETFAETSGFAHYCVKNKCALVIAHTHEVDGKWFGTGDAYEPSSLLAGTGKPVHVPAFVSPKAVEVERSVLYYPLVTRDTVTAVLKIADFSHDHAYNVRHVKQIRALSLPIGSFLEDVNTIATLRARLEHEAENKKLVELANTLFLYREIALGMFHQVTNYTNRVESELMLIESKMATVSRPAELETHVIAARNVIRDAKELIRKAQHRGRSLTPISQDCMLVDDIVRPALRYIERDHPEVGLKHSLTNQDYKVEVDPAYMREGLYNLLNNAVWAVKQNRAPKREIFVAVRPQDADNVRIHVEDSGVGIESDFWPNLFKPFATTRQDGTGLGLYFARQLVEHFGGRLELERSSPGRTVFAITLPMREMC